MISPSAEQIRLSDLLTWFVERLELEGWRALPCRSCERDGRMGVNVLHDSIKAMLDLLASQSRALEEAQRDAEQHLARANEEIGMRHDAQIAYTQSEQKRLMLIDQLTVAQAEIAQLKAHNESMMDTIVEFTKDESAQLRDAKVLLERAQGEIERLKVDRDHVGNARNNWQLRAEQAEAARERLREALTELQERTAADGDMADRAVHDFIAEAFFTPVRPSEDPQG